MVKKYGSVLVREETKIQIESIRRATANRSAKAVVEDLVQDAYNKLPKGAKA